MIISAKIPLCRSYPAIKAGRSAEGYNPCAFALKALFFHPGKELFFWTIIFSYRRYSMPGLLVVIRYCFIKLLQQFGISFYNKIEWFGIKLSDDLFISFFKIAFAPSTFGEALFHYTWIEKMCSWIFSLFWQKRKLGVMIIWKMLLASLKLS